MIAFMHAPSNLLVTLAVAVALLGYLLWRVQKDQTNPFDLLDLLMENGKASKFAVVLLGSFLMTTWMMVYLTVTNRITEGYLTIYVSAWIAPVVARLVKDAFVDSKKPNDPNS